MPCSPVTTLRPLLAKCATDRDPKPPSVDITHHLLAQYANCCHRQHSTRMMHASRQQTTFVDMSRFLCTGSTTCSPTWMATLESATSRTPSVRWVQMVYLEPTSSCTAVASPFQLCLLVPRAELQTTELHLSPPHQGCCTSPLMQHRRKALILHRCAAALALGGGLPACCWAMIDIALKLLHASQLSATLQTNATTAAR